MAPLPNSFLCFSRAITYVIMQRKQLGGGAIADGETDAKNASVDGPLNGSIAFRTTLVRSSRKGSDKTSFLSMFVFDPHTPAISLGRRQAPDRGPLL
jgi:hypothetical protein